MEKGRVVRHILQEAFQKRKGFNSKVIFKIFQRFFYRLPSTRRPPLFFLSSTFLLARFSDTQPSLSYGYSSRARAQEGKPALLGPHTETSSRPDQGAQGLSAQAARASLLPARREQPSLTSPSFASRPIASTSLA